LFQIISTDLAGSILAWDFVKQVEVAQCNIGSPILEVVTCSSFEVSDSLLPKEVLVVIGRTDATSTTANKK
jgi:hypothetical protein